MECTSELDVNLSVFLTTNSNYDNINCECSGRMFNLLNNSRHNTLLLAFIILLLFSVIWKYYYCRLSYHRNLYLCYDWMHIRKINCSQFLRRNNILQIQLRNLPSLGLDWSICFQDSVLCKVRPKKFVLQLLLIGLTLQLICISIGSLGFAMNCMTWVLLKLLRSNLSSWPSLIICEQNETRKPNNVVIIIFVDYKLFFSLEVSNPNLCRLETAANPSVLSVFWVVFLSVCPTWSDIVSGCKGVLNVVRKVYIIHT
jgi:hypothetical protein